MRLTRPVPLAAAAVLAAVALLPTPGHAQGRTAGPARPASADAAGVRALDSLTLAAFRWRAIGPANFEGRVTDVVGIPSPSRTLFVATAGGGIWKTTNAGTTFRPVFEKEKVVSMGAIAIAPSDTSQVWAGTGEQNSRNTIEPGGGVYKSNDGGLTWRLMGLEKTQHVGRIVVHPTNPDVVYVAALGAAWKSNPERGLYRTDDGGRTWKLVKFVSDRAGFIDVALDPKNPDVVWASSYERVRGPYFLKSGGPGSALWKSGDGGDTWTEITGGGFPATSKGRIEVAVFPQNPDVVYAMVEADSIRGRKAAPDAPRQKLGNGLYRTLDGGKTWEKMNDANTRPFYYSQVRVDPRNRDRVYFSSTPVLVSDDGGKTARPATQGIHVDHHAMWIDPNDPAHIVVGNDGGVAQTWDGGGNYDFGAVLPIAQFYDVSYDFQQPYTICAGAQDNGSWCGPSRHKNRPVTNADWFPVGGGDGFYTAQHPTEPWIVFVESQGGNVSRLDLRTGERTALVKPSWRPRYAQVEDSILVAQGDTAATAAVPRDVPRDATRRIGDLRARQLADSTRLDVRFNWETPFLISPHDAEVMYVAGSRVLKSTRRGDDLFPISADLSKKQYAKIDSSMRKTGGITLDATGAETYGTVVALAESPVRPGFLYAGTDDGNVWTTRTDGATWEQIAASRFAGLPAGDVYVSRIEPSHFDSLTFYIAFDNHRWNDFTPYLYVTTDGGRTFRSLAGDLPHDSPADFVHVVREDPDSRDLLYVGTSRAVYVSTDRGAHWQRFMTGMPTVPVYDLKIHPRDRELIAATHGRGLWIVSVAPLEQLTADSTGHGLADAAYLYRPKTAYQYGDSPSVGVSPNGGGHKVFSAPSPAYGAEIVYRVRAGATPAATAAVSADSAGRRGGRARTQARIVITDAKGDTLRTLTGPATAGLHRVTWDFRGRPAAPRAPLSLSQRRDSVQQARRMTVVFDSLVQAGTLARAQADRLQELLASGDAGALFRGGGAAGGRGGRSGAWNARPGEGRVIGARRGAQRDSASAASGAEARGGEEQPMEMINAAFPTGFSQLQELLRVPGARVRPDRNAVRPQAPVVRSGDYLVTLSIGGQNYRQLLRVERTDRGNDHASAGDDDDDHADRNP